MGRGEDRGALDWFHLPPGDLKATSYARDDDTFAARRSAGIRPAAIGT
jgi:hypothetical protein